MRKKKKARARTAALTKSKPGKKKKTRAKRTVANDDLLTGKYCIVADDGHYLHENDDGEFTVPDEILPESLFLAEKGAAKIALIEASDIDTNLANATVELATKHFATSFDIDDTLKLTSRIVLKGHDISRKGAVGDIRRSFREQLRGCEDEIRTIEKELAQKLKAHDQGRKELHRESQALLRDRETTRRTLQRKLEKFDALYGEK